MRSRSSAWIVAIAIALASVTSASAATLRSPDIADVVGLGAGAGALIGSEVFKERIGPYAARLTAPNSIDETVRKVLVWRADRGLWAARLSDVLLFGGYVPMILWTPVVAGGDMAAGMAVMAESFVANGVATNAIKFGVARERPYAHYGTYPRRGVDDQLSFISGHASHAFALATAAGLLLVASNPQLGPAIWPALYLPAAATAYLRIASDRHYLTDVVAGAAVGTAVGWWSARQQIRASRGDSRVFRIGGSFTF